MTASSLEGRRLGRYHLVHLLGRGGMASVYLARALGQSGFDRWVAVKAIDLGPSDDPRFARMFENEARLSSRLYHPNICAVSDYGEADGVRYLVMEYLHGEPLVRLMDEGIPTSIAVRIVIDAARGLHAAHELRDEHGAPLGLVHRDVSPQNIVVLYDGIAKVVDFGIARARDHAAETTVGVAKGKLAYMAPEQLHLGVIDRRTDVFALGIVTWEATLGWRLFKRSTPPATMSAVLSDEVPLPSRVKPDYPAELEAAVMRALERDPSKRFQTMEAYLEALEAALYSSGYTATSSQVGSWMKETFEQALEVRECLLWDLGTQTYDDGPLPDGPVPTPAAPPSQGERRRAAVAAASIVALIAASVVAVGVAWRGERAAAPDGQRPAASAVQTFAPEPPAPFAPIDVAGPRGLEAGVVDASLARGDEPGLDDGAPAGPGFVNFMSIPVAEVWLGSRKLGTTPLLRFPVPPGRHRVSLKALGPVDGGEAERRVSVVVTSGKVSYVSVRFGTP